MTAPLQNTYAFSEEAYVFLKKGVRVFLGEGISLTEIKYPDLSSCVFVLLFKFIILPPNLSKDTL